MRLGLVPMGTPVITRIEPGQVAGWRGMGVTSLGARFPDDLTEIDEAACRAFRSMLADHGAELAQIWIFERPLFHPDAAHMARDHADLRRALALTSALGCPVLIVGGGSFHPEGAFSPHPLNQTDRAVDAIIDAARRVVPAAEEHGVHIAIEPLTLAIVRSARCMRQIIDGVGSRWLGINLDPVNMMTLDTVFYMTDAVNEMFDLLGEHILAAHAKDGVLEPRVLVHLSECLCGTGQMDWRTFVRRFAQLESWKTLALEHTRDEDVPAALGHLRACAVAEGVAFT